MPRSDIAGASAASPGLRHRGPMRSVFSERACALPAHKRRERYRHFASAAFSMTSATCFACTTSEAWLPATSVVWALILAANYFCASGARTLSFVLMT